MYKLNLPIPLDEPSFNNKEMNYVTACFKKGWISWQGEFVKKFEKKFSKLIKYKYAISTANGTDALILALKALDLKKGDEVIVPTLTFSASVFSISEIGAKPIFVDNNPGKLDIDVNQIEKKINKKTKAIMVVHLYGRPVKIEAIKNIAKKRNLYIIEDCAESLGAKYKNKITGSFADISCFSFHNKLIATGEGGMVLTNKKRLFDQLEQLRNPSPDNRTKFKKISLNSRMSNINSAIGLAQLEKLNSFVRKKRNIAKLYEKNLKDVKDIKLFYENKNCKSSYWRHSFMLQSKTIRDKLIFFLKKKKIISRGIFSPMHLHPLYFKKNNKFPNAEKVSKTSIDIPSSINLSKKQIIYITNCIKEFFSNEN